jgi:tetratricopeptide (TPR) repeat protein/predicted Ser/Thr protein kinase
VVGTHIAHYRVLELLGEGGMGEVYLVEDSRLQRRAALKLINASLTHDETRRQRFVQEARLAASIDHPHIAAIYDVGEFDGRVFIVMEYVEGRSLREVLQSGPLPLRQALDRAIEAGDAIAKVHERGVIHRDLKPENLLIARDGYAKVIDFGLAKLADPLARSGLADAATVADDHVRTADGVVMGTIGYMSPEQVRGDALDARSDIFSFGAVLYEMVTGTAPFRKKSAAETIGAILADTPAPPHVDGVAAGTELHRIVRKCLAKEADSRYQGMRDLVVDLREFRNTLASSGSTPRPEPPVPAATRRWPPPRALGVAALLLALIVAGLAWHRNRPGPAEGAGSAAAPARLAVAIVPFEVMGGHPDLAWLGKGLPSMLITGLAQTPEIEVIGTERLSDAARQVGAANLDAVDRSQLSDLARRTGARFVLSGTIVQAGGDLRIDARVEDLTTGAVRLAESVRGVDALTLADDLAGRVRRGLDVRVAASAVRPVAEVSTSSVEAYRAYLAGLEAEYNYRFADARRLFQEAIALDPGFGLAYFHLSTVADFQGRIRERGEWLQQAAGHLDRMPERDAVLVRAEVARAAGRIEDAERLLEDLVGRYPETEVAWLKLGFWAFASNPAETLALFERATAALPHSPVMLNLLGYSQVLNGRYEEGLRSFEGYVKLRPSEGNAFDSLAEGQLVAGHLSDALSTFDAAFERGYGGGASGRALVEAILGRYDEALADPSRVGGTLRALLLSRLGRYDEAGRLLASVRRTYESNGWSEGVVSIDLTTATYALEQDRCQIAGRAVAAAERVLATIPEGLATHWQVYADLVAGVCDAREGRHDAARQRVEHARQIHRTSAPFERWWLGVLEAEVALARGDHETAARAFGSGRPAGRMFFNRHLYFFMPSVLANHLILRDAPARIAIAQGRPAEAIAVYRRLLTSGPGQPWTAALEPRYVLALAGLLDTTGDRAAARTEYRRFLDYWKDADAGLPEIAAARAALRR